ncbi:MAG TPA: hypothetical protein VHB72_02600 [Candidatus Saccharimonadales bacterium]|nr:hypothetical protein [Candidatus Saccharimonadales bacterium]
MEEPDRVDGLRQKLLRYKPSTATAQLVQQTPILLLVGISGAGKDSIKTKLLATGNYHHIISHTTRPPRENRGILERDGVEYHFINLAQAEKMLDEGAYVEAKMYSGNVYGTSVAEIQAAHDEGKIAVTDLEVQGVAEYKAMAPDSVYAVFILPPDYDTWQERLKSRYGDSIHQHDLHKRMHTAKLELQDALEKNYFRFVINDELGQTVEAVDEIAHGASAGKESDEGRHVAQEILARLEAAL